MGRFKPLTSIGNVVSNAANIAPSIPRPSQEVIRGHYEHATVVSSSLGLAGIVLSHMEEQVAAELQREARKQRYAQHLAKPTVPAEVRVINADMPTDPIMSDQRADQEAALQAVASVTSDASLTSPVVLTPEDAARQAINEIYEQRARPGAN